MKRENELDGGLQSNFLGCLHRPTPHKRMGSLYPSLMEDNDANVFWANAVKALEEKEED